MVKQIKIGNVSFPKTAALAPMASVADRAYRIMCRRYGAAYVVSEMVSAKALCYGDKKSKQLLTVTAAEEPMAIQLFGSEPETMARAVQIVNEYHPCMIDVNMGCPVPKVAGNGCGSALMKTPETAAAIVRTMKAETDLPMTVKFRKGWDDNSVNAPEFAKLMEEAGADAVAVHGRTKMQMYRPPVDREIIRRVKESVSVPVIGNGGILDAVSAKQMYDETGCDLVFVAQGSYGKPWIFKQIEAYLTDGTLLADPPVSERLDIMLEHISLMIKDKGEHVAMMEARRQAAFYMKGLPGAAHFRFRCGSLSTYEELRELVRELKQHTPHE